MEKYPVENFNYSGLVEEMCQAGFDKMSEVLNQALRALPKARWANEKDYFWKALFNAARSNDMVWLWLATQPLIRAYDPSHGLHTSGQFVGEWELPVIGGSDDRPAERFTGPKQWSADQNEENFLDQANNLDQYLREEGQKDPSNRCKNIWGYVSTWYYSGTGVMAAQIQMVENGYLGLATRKGIDWLREKYAPSKNPNNTI